MDFSGELVQICMKATSNKRIVRLHETIYMPVHTYSHIYSQQKGFLVSMVSGGSLDSTYYSSLHMCCVHIGTVISKNKKSTFLKYFLMDNFINFVKSLPSINLTPKNAWSTNTPQVALNCSTMVHQLLGTSLSKTGGENLLCCKTDFVLYPLNCLNSMPKKKSLLQESYTTKPRYTCSEKKKNKANILYAS